jgi:hypothetical protein
VLSRTVEGLSNECLVLSVSLASPLSALTGSSARVEDKSCRSLSGCSLAYAYPLHPLCAHCGCVCVPSPAKDLGTPESEAQGAEAFPSR